MAQHANEWEASAVIVPRLDLKWTDWPKENRQRRVSYEEVLREPSAPFIKRCVLFQMKSPFGQGFDDAHGDRYRFCSSLCRILKKWLRDGAHLLFIMPSCRSQPAAKNERELAGQVALLVGDLVPGLGDAWRIGDFGGLPSHPLDSNDDLPIGEGDVGFHFEERDRDGLLAPSFPEEDDSNEDSGSSKVVVPLARNSMDDLVSLSARVGSGCVSVVPRSLLDGPLRYLRGVVPNMLNFEFKTNERPTEKRAGILRVNGEPVELGLYQYEYVKLLWHWWWNQHCRDVRHIAWTELLSNDKKREKVGEGLRKQLPELGLNVIEPGSGDRSPRLSNQVVPPGFSIQGWETPEKSWRAK